MVTDFDGLDSSLRVAMGRILRSAANSEGLSRWQKNKPLDSKRPSAWLRGIELSEVEERKCLTQNPSICEFHGRKSFLVKLDLKSAFRHQGDCSGFDLRHTTLSTSELSETGQKVARFEIR
ncbi:hypothetical protein E4U53_000213, partial [Claviceps sorghi]